MTFKELLQESKKQLTTSATSELDTKVLLKKAFSLDETRLFLKLDEEITDRDAFDTFNSLIAQRKEGIPISYIIGHKEFYGKNFIVNPHVLIPRPETEFMIEYVKGQVVAPKTILELGTGTGCISITLQNIYPNAKITATDISPTALQVATKNATMLTDSDEITFLESDLLSNVENTQWDIIVANLPYLDQKKHTDDSIRHEPNLALYAESEGLELYQELFRGLDSRHFYFKIALFEMLQEQALKLHNDIQKGYPTWQSEVLPHPGGIVTFLKLTSK